MRLRRHVAGDHDLARIDDHPPADQRHVARRRRVAGAADQGAQGQVGGKAVASAVGFRIDPAAIRSDEHTSELQSLMRNSYAVLCLQTETHPKIINTQLYTHTYTLANHITTL